MVITDLAVNLGDTEYPGEQRQLAEEDTAADRADISRQLCELLSERDTPKQKPVRSELPAHFVVLKTVRPQYGCPGCNKVHSPALPPSLIEKGQPGRGLLAQVVVYDMLAGWSGTLMVDDYGGYKALLRPEGDTPVPVKEAGCLAHVRRKFADLFKMNGSPG